MSDEGNFFIYCFEVYKAAKGMTGKETIELFKRWGVTEYLLACYEALHTTGENYIIRDIDLYLQTKTA